jgi:hypothetical protein
MGIKLKVIKLNAFMSIKKFPGLTIIKKAIDVPVQMQLGFLSDKLQNKLKWGPLNRSVIYDNIHLHYDDIWYCFKWHNTSDIYKQIMSGTSIPPQFPTRLLLLKSDQCDKQFHQNDLHNENDGTIPLMTVHIGNDINLLIKSLTTDHCENVSIESGDALIFNSKLNDVQFKYNSIKSNSGPKKISNIIGNNILYYTFRG